MLATTPAPIVAPAATLGDLHAVMAELIRAYPEAGHRVQHGAFLAVMGHAESDAALGWWVRSERDAETRYFVLPEYGTCTCQDHQRQGHMSPCKHAIAVEVLRRLERAEAERDEPTETLLDVAGAPIPFRLTPAALAALDEARQRDTARCPECNTWKQHGSLYCSGDACERPRPALRLVAVDGAARQ